VEDLNTITAPLQTEISKVVAEGGKVLSTSLNSWWKIGSQVVSSAMEKVRETLEEPQPAARPQGSRGETAQAPQTQRDPEDADPGSA